MNYNPKFLEILENPQITCSDVARVSQLHFEGEQPRALDLRIQDHIQSCEQCAEYDYLYKNVAKVAKEIYGETKTVPEGVSVRLRNHLTKELGISF